MKLSNIKYLAVVALLGLTTVSCSDFLDRPTEDSYNADNYYNTDDQCIAGVNYLYNVPWYDFQRGFIKVGEVLSGNYYWGSSPYLTFTVNGSDEDLVNMWYSLWSVNAHANAVYNNIKASIGPSKAIKNKCMGECLVWKAMAYFYLVRSFGDIPIIHDNTAELNDGTYNDCYSVQKGDVYEYIVMTLEKAMELLAGVNEKGNGRIDYYSAEALLAKVYLTKAGVYGQRSASDLAMAAQLALDVKKNSGRDLLENYSDNFRLANNKNEESLIAWQWVANYTNWTEQNTLQSDLAIVGFDEFGDCWGGYCGPSVDLQEAFGVKLLENQPESWINNADTRCKATMMLPGYTYSYFWQDKGGFDYLRFLFDGDYNAAKQGLQSATGANNVKHLYGDGYDHELATGTSAKNMASSLATHLLRLSDVYLIYAEAAMGTANSTSDPEAIDAYYEVHRRAVPSAKKPKTITWEDVWKERRLELAMEGDRWYDYVRVSYYDPDFCINELKNQKRNAIWNLGDVYETYYTSGTWKLNDATAYDTQTSAPNVTKNSFTLPKYTDDVTFNSKIMEDAISVNVYDTYSY